MTNFEELYELSNKIKKKLDELFTLTINKIIEPNSREYDVLIEEIKLLVLKENALVSSLEREDVDICLIDLKTLLNENFEGTRDYDLNELDGLEICIKNLACSLDKSKSQYNIDALIRVFDRLKNRIYILDGEVISLRFRLNSGEVINYEVSIWDAITSELNIEFLKTMKAKIYKLIPVQSGDSKIISELKNNFENLKLYILFGNFASEIKTLYSKNNFDRIKIADINRFKKMPCFDMDMYNCILYGNAECYVEELADTTHLEYNPEDVFSFLVNVTFFEVMTKYMDLPTLRDISTYCKGVSTKENEPCMSGINKFVRARIKREEKK